MANIQKYLDDIKKALFGREVRSSIHDAIEAINKETERTTTSQEHLDSTFKQLIINAGQSNAEVVDARVEADGTPHATLGDRLDNLDSKFGITNKEVVDARTDKKGIAHKDLKTRLDNIDSQVEYNTNKDGYIRGKFKKSNGCVMTFICDDGVNTDYTKLLPLIKEKKITCGLAILPDKINTAGYMTTENIKEFLEIGCTLLSHGSSTAKEDQQDFLTLTEEELRFCLEDSKNKIERMFNVNCFGLVYPYNNTNTKVKNIVRDYYEFAYGRYNSTKVSGFNHYPYQFDNYNIKRVSIGYAPDDPIAGFPNDTTSLDYYKARLDDAIDNNALICFVLHTGFGTTFDDQIKNIKDLIDYARDQGVDIVEPYTAFYQKGNIVQIGEPNNKERFIIDNKGNLNSLSLLHKLEKPNKHKINDSILSEFDQQKITCEVITSSTATSEGYPESKPGILTTYKYTSESFAMFQEYYVSETEKLYRRKVDSSFNWLEWNLVNPDAQFLYTGFNTFKGSQSILDYPKNKLIYTNINNSFAASNNYPKGLGGLLKTYNLTTDYYGRYQEYEISSILNQGISETYIRYINSDNTWSEWKLKGRIEYERTITNLIVPANSTINVEIGKENIVNSKDIITFELKSNPPVGVIWSRINTSALRFANMTSSPITIDNLTVMVTCLKQ